MEQLVNSAFVSVVRQTPPQLVAHLREEPGEQGNLEPS